MSPPHSGEEAGPRHGEKHLTLPLEVMQVSPSGSVLCLVKPYGCVRVCYHSVTQTGWRKQQKFIIFLEAGSPGSGAFRADFK